MTALTAVFTLAWTVQKLIPQVAPTIPALTDLTITKKILATTTFAYSYFQSALPSALTAVPLMASVTKNISQTLTGT